VGESLNTSGGPVKHFNRSYTYDPVGNIMNIHDNNGNFDFEYQYDDLYRLIWAKYPSFASPSTTKLKGGAKPSQKK
jgi:hypothetical protein